MSNAMTIDSRQHEADLVYARWVHRGVPSDVVRELLPMLVGPARTSRARQRAAEALETTTAALARQKDPER